MRGGEWKVADGVLPRASRCGGNSLTLLGLRPNIHGCPGQVAEWLKAPVSKTGIPFTRYREFESLPVRFDAILVDSWCDGTFESRRFLLLLPGGEVNPGRVAEWFKAHAWKVCVRQKRTVGSNPTPSVE